MTESAPPAELSRTRRATTAIKGWPRQIPATFILGVLILGFTVAAVPTWLEVGFTTQIDQAYGLPAFEQGRWWSIFTGSLTMLVPWQVLPTLFLLFVFFGFGEIRLGWRKSVVVLILGQFVSILLPALWLWLREGGGLIAHLGVNWAWANDLSTHVDLGMSGGFFAVAGAASVTLRPPWRARIRAGLLAYSLLSLIYIGALWDVAHMLGLLLGFFLGPLLVGRRPQFRPRKLSRTEIRLATAVFFLLSAAIEILSWVFTPDGIFGDPTDASTDHDLADLVISLILASLWVLLAYQLRRGRRTAWRWAVGFTLFATVILLLIALALILLDEPGLPSVSYSGFVVLTQLVLLLGGRAAFRNPSPRRARRADNTLLAPSTQEKQLAARETLTAYGSANRLSWMTTWPENQWCALPQSSPASDAAPWQGFVTYRAIAGVALGLCDPVGQTPEATGAALDHFITQAKDEGLIPCLFTVTEDVVAHTQQLRWQSVQVAEEAIVDLPDLEFKGKPWQNVRTALNHAKKAEITHQLVSLAQVPRGIQLQVQAISDHWVSEKGLPEMGFTLGGVTEALDPAVRVGLALDPDGTVHGVTSWLPVYSPGGGDTPTGWTLDVMRRLPEGDFRPVMEYLIAAAALEFQAEGAQLLSLSGAPLARAKTDDTELNTQPLDPFLAKLAETLEPYYGFQSLHAFKAKFRPRYAPLSLVFPDEAALPRIGVALTKAYLPTASLRDFLGMATAIKG